MHPEIKIDRLRYFLEGYYNQSFDDKDLEKLVYEFRYHNNLHNVNNITKELFQELISLQELDDWELVAPKLTGDRRFTPPDARELVETMLRCLTDESWDPEKHTPFF